MKTDAEIRMEGMPALIGSLGQIEAERFQTCLSRDHFAYTELHRHGLPRCGVDELARLANRCAHEAASAEATSDKPRDETN